MRCFTISTALMLCLVSTTVLADDSKAAKPNGSTESNSQLGKETVTFDGDDLILAWQGKNEDAGELIREYIPADQSLETWTKLASIREYPDLPDPAALANGLATLVKQQHPDSALGIQANSNDETIVDFVLWGEDKSFVEFNVFKYRKRPEGGTIAEQFAVREYRDPQRFVNDLKPLRDRLVGLMDKEGLHLDKSATEEPAK